MESSLGGLGFEGWGVSSFSVQAVFLLLGCSEFESSGEGFGYSGFGTESFQVLGCIGVM